MIGRHSRQAKVRESSLDLRDELLANAVLEIVLLVLVALLDAGVTTDRADIDHAVAELDEGTALLGDLEVGNVVQDELDELLVRLLANPLDERRRGERDAHAVCGQTVLGEAEVEEAGDGNGSSTELFLLLDEIATANEANGDLVTKLRQESEHLGGDHLYTC
jgi:hypothetical protein